MSRGQISRQRSEVSGRMSKTSRACLTLWIDSVSEQFFNVISGWETGGNIEEELDDLIFSHNQLTAIRFQNCFSDCRCHALIAVSERVRLRQVVRVRRGARRNIGSFVPMPVLLRRGQIPAS